MSLLNLCNALMLLLYKIDADNMNADALRSMLEDKLIVANDNDEVADGCVGGFKI